MKKVKPQIKGLLTLLAVVAGVVLFSIALFNGLKQQNSLYCTEIEVVIEDDDYMGFLDKADVKDLVTNYNSDGLIGTELTTLDYEEVENRLRKNPYIETTEIYVNKQGVLIAQVTQKTPVIRIINSGGVSYYMSEKGDKIPLSDKFTARVLVVTGHVPNVPDGNQEQESITQDLLRLSAFIQGDEFWNAMVGQVNVTEEGEIELVTQAGDHVVMIGQIDEEMESKFRKLEIFYKEGLSKVGYDQYAYINLKYKNQIVCTKN